MLLKADAAMAPINQNNSQFFNLNAQDKNKSLKCFFYL